MKPVDISWQRKERLLRATLLSKVLVWLLVILGLADLVVLVTGAGLRGTDDAAALEAVVGAATLFDQAVKVMPFATLAAYLFFGWWLAHRMAQLGRLRVAGQTYSPGSVVTAFLLPGVTAFLPYRIAEELWRSSHTPVDFSDTLAWRGAPVSRRLLWWWWAVLVAGVCWIFWCIELTQLRPELMSDPALLQVHVLTTMVAAATQLAAVWLTVALVLGLDRRQLQRFCEVQQRYAMTASGTTATGQQAVAARAPLTAAHAWQALGMGAALQALFLLAGVLFQLPSWWFFVSTQVALLAVAVIIARSEDVPLRRLVAWSQPRPRDLRSGLEVGIGAFGLAALLLFPWLESLAPERQDRLREMLTAVPWPVVLLTVLVAAPVVEELLFRGVLFEALSSALPPAAVVVLTAGIFALIHGNLPQIIATFVVGLHCGLVRLLSGSVTPAILVHFVNNAAAVFVLPHAGETDGALTVLLCLPFAGLLVVCYSRLWAPRSATASPRAPGPAARPVQQAPRPATGPKQGPVVAPVPVPRPPPTGSPAQVPRPAAIPAQDPRPATGSVQVPRPAPQAPRPAAIPVQDPQAAAIPVQAPRAEAPRPMTRAEPAARGHGEPLQPATPPPPQALWRGLRDQLWGGPLAHGLAVALATLLALRYLMKTLQAWRSEGTAMLLVATFFGYWAWGMWRERKAQSTLSFATLVFVLFARGLIQGFGGWDVVLAVVFLSGTVAVYREMHLLWINDPARWPFAAEAAAGEEEPLPAHPEE